MIIPFVTLVPILVTLLVTRGLKALRHSSLKSRGGGDAPLRCAAQSAAADPDGSAELRGVRRSEEEGVTGDEEEEECVRVGEDDDRQRSGGSGAAFTSLIPGEFQTSFPVKPFNYLQFSPVWGCWCGSRKQKPPNYLSMD